MTSEKEKPLLRIGAILVARRDDFDGGNQLAVVVDVDGTLRVEADGDARFQVWLDDAVTVGRGLGNRSLPPLPYAEFGFAVASIRRQRWDAAEERLVSLRKSLLNVLQQVRQP
jgi:hypothetical protein